MGGIVEGATQLWGSIEGANAEIDAAKRQSYRERQQADMAIRSAQERGAFEAGRQRRKGTEVAAEQRSAYTASGVDATQGTAAAVQADTAALSELDAQTLSINAAREAWGYREQKRQIGENFQATAKNANQKGTAGAIGGLTKYGAGWMKMGGG